MTTAPLTPAPIGDLSSEEIRLIHVHRAEQAHKAHIKVRRLELLKAAYEFEAFRQANGAGLTFSTFTNDFGFEGENRPDAFWTVEKLIAFAHEAAQHGQAAKMPTNE